MLLYNVVLNNKRWSAMEQCQIGGWMKAVILAGGYGTQISEESTVRPKPMVEIGGQPILWHIMKMYSMHDINEFVICCGYKGWMIKEYFANYFLHRSDVTFDLQHNSMDVHRNTSEPWKVTLVHTGHKSMTGGRIKRVREYLDNETFCLTYGDGLSDVDITELINFHREQRTDRRKLKFLLELYEPRVDVVRFY